MRQQRGPEVKLQDAVAAEQQPVGAGSRQDDAAKTRAFEVAAGERCDTPRAERHGADVLRRGEAHAERHKRARVHRLA